MHEKERLPRDPTDRLTALEIQVKHLGDLMRIQERLFAEKTTELTAHNKVQDLEAERRSERWERELEKLTAKQWNFITWASVALFNALLLIVLKGLRLV